MNRRTCLRFNYIPIGDKDKKYKIEILTENGAFD